MCGITGCLKYKTAVESIISALGKLQNRGYDSVGMAVVKDNNLLVSRYVSDQSGNAIKFLQADAIVQQASEVAIGHTRWATHGAKLICNCHPHTDTDNRFAVIHNGIIENYTDLRDTLLEYQTKFYGQTDTEVVAKYYAYLVDKNQVGQHLSILSNSMTGSWAILILDKMNPSTIYFLKNGSPLLVGLTSAMDKIMFSSELIGFDADITDYFSLNDGDYGYAKIDGDMCTIHTNYTYNLLPVPQMDMATSPAPYNHWTIKEIYDQPTAVRNLLEDRLVIDINNNNSDRAKIFFPELAPVINDVLCSDHFIFLGCGTSYHAAQIAARFFKKFNSGCTVDVIDGADFEITDIPSNRRTIIILYSQSGETKDLYQALIMCSQQKIKTIGIINVENSLIARNVDAVIYLRANRENAVASTKCFTNQIVVSLLLAIWKSMAKDKIQTCTDWITVIDNPNIWPNIRALATIATELNEIIAKSIMEIPKIIPWFDTQTSCFALGKHINEWIAKEACLKIKEISYVHCEGFNAASLKHGPFALLTKNMPIIIIAPNDQYFSKIENVITEIKSRMACVILVSNNIHTKIDVDYHFCFKTDSVLFPILSIVPMQILAYSLSLQFGYNPDYPRNLAKVVTVD